MDDMQPATRSKAQIPSALERLSIAIDGLFAEVDQISGALSSVVHPSTPEGPSGDKDKQEFRVPLAEVIWTASVKVDAATRSLAALRARSEL